jgi:chromosome segregation ATPase
MAKDLTLEVLKQIRDEVRRTNVRIENLTEHVEDLRDELGRRIVESETRTATALTDLAGTVRQLTDLLRSQADLRPRVERCEQEIAALKQQISQPH